MQALPIRSPGTAGLYSGEQVRTETLDDGAPDFASLSEKQVMTLYPTAAVKSSANGQGAFEILNPSLVPPEASGSVELGCGTAPVAAHTAIRPG